MAHKRWFVAAAGIALWSGCSPVGMATAAGKGAFKAIAGAEADVTPVRLLGRTDLGKYGRIEPGKVTSDVPTICTPEVQGKVRIALGRVLAGERARKVFPGGDHTLRADVVVRFCKERGAIGGEGRLDWLVTLGDKATGEAVGVLYVEGVSESPLEHGIADMAEKNGTELIKFLGKHRRGDD